MKKQDDDGGRFRAYLADRQADAWMEFLMTGRPTALAEYLHYHGPVDTDVRAALIATLRAPALENKGGRDSWRDYQTFVAINVIVTSAGVSKTEACRRHAAELNQELRRVELQYQRGAKIFSAESDLFSAPDPNEK
ncbi:MAG: hypothetical protein EOS51_27280 [Mesorhizobium sp.]|uniref:hypothetical protein n=1 Tax=unclassified Mesorhizobium TaxID=325217 RepID=UPI000FE94D36|nr:MULTISPECIES: hypothetical protein [unclassified Mesorhizobium]RWC07590.1 MAG: hypothetical protein EOS51_27280 [Mesorhizobium sp.]TGT93865.1 hypothetical protein EN807_26820 [Mesorhizobium sp. M5C.F.Ca.ET.164.01.1.1]